MTFSAKIIVLRVDKPVANKKIGDVIDIIPLESFEGKEVIKVGKDYSRIHISDLDEILAEDLKSGSKRLKTPKTDSDFYKTLLINGYIEATNDQLLNYVELS